MLDGTYEIALVYCGVGLKMDTSLVWIQIGSLSESACGVVLGTHTHTHTDTHNTHTHTHTCTHTCPNL